MVRLLAVLVALALSAVVLPRSAMAAGWGPLTWGMTEREAKEALGGKATETLKRAFRLGDYKAEFRGPAYALADGIQMRPLPLFSVKTGRLEIVILTAEQATSRDFVALYRSLVARYGEEQAAHSLRRGQFRVFDARWREAPTGIGLFFDQGGRLLTLEFARTKAASPDPYGDETWLRTDAWANICGCDLPIYYYRCGEPGAATEPASAEMLQTPFLP